MRYITKRTIVNKLGNAGGQSECDRYYHRRKTKIIKGVAEIIIDTFEEGAGKKRKKRIIKYPLSKNMTEQDVLEWVGKDLVKITILGGMIDNIWQN